MKAAILRGIKQISIEEVDRPQIMPDQVLVRLKAVGVCGSDVHYYLHGRIGNQVVTSPFILGHEPAGEIAEVGSAVKNLKPGMAVAVEPGIPCRQCENCHKGKYNLCPNVEFLGTPPVQGAYREYIAYNPDFLFPLPSTMSFAEGALIETLAVGMYASELAGLQPGDDIAILGSGPVGLVTLKAARLRGVNRIFITDRIAERLSVAAAHKDVIAINITKENPAEVIREMTKGRGVDTVFEAAGALETVNQAVELACIGGKIVLIGIPAEDFVSFDSHINRRKELTHLALRRFRHMFPRCIQAVASGNIVLKDLITHNFSLEEIEKPFHLVENYQDGVVKAIINI